jgi:hypothetical protein
MPWIGGRGVCFEPPLMRPSFVGEREGPPMPVESPIVSWRQPSDWTQGSFSPSYKYFECAAGFPDELQCRLEYDESRQWWKDRWKIYE